MKRIAVLAFIVALGLAFGAYAQNTAPVKIDQKTVTSGDTTTTTTKMSDKSDGLKAKTEVVKSGNTTMVTEEMKGKNVKVERAEITNPAGQAGLAAFKIKKGALKDFQIEWTYHQAGTEYITEYTINDKTNKALMKELNLTPEQVATIMPGKHTVVSTSAYTGRDIRSDIRGVILKDIQNAANNRAMKKAKKKGY